MKIVTLNVWGGRVMPSFQNFFDKYQDVDIFCFQEVYHDAHGKDTIWLDGTNLNFLSDVKKMIPGYRCIYHPHLGDWWGLATFVKKDLEVISSGEEYVFQEKGYNMDKEVLGHTAKNIQHTEVSFNGKPLVIMNLHGLWNGQGKSDTEDRIRQSENIIKFVNSLGKDFVLVGDLNLNPDTESFKMLETSLSVRNLISEYGITSTRTSFYKKENKFADYVFVSKGTEVKDFKVLPEEVSDHAALLLEI